MNNRQAIHRQCAWADRLAIASRLRARQDTCRVALVARGRWLNPSPVLRLRWVTPRPCDLSFPS